MKKICFCTTIPLTIRAFILKSAEYLHEHTDWDISFVCDYDEEFKNSLPGYFHYYPVKMKRGVSPDGLAAVRQMKKIFKREKFDMVQFSTPNAAFYASIAAKRAGIPVRNYHLMGLRYMGAKGKGRAVLKKMDKLACKNATAIECVSRSNLELGIKEGLFPPEKATVVWNGSTGGVDLKRFDYKKREEWRADTRRELGINKDDFVFGFVGRLNKDKGVNELLRAFIETERGAKLLLIGFDSEIDTLDQSLLTQAKERKDIIFHSSVSDIERYYAALDVLVLPSYREGFGNVVIEAAAVGTPAIVSDIPGPMDAIIRGKTALAVKPGVYPELKTAMDDIRKLDCRSMGNDAFKYVESHFDSEILFEKILERKRALLAEATDG